MEIPNTLTESYEKLIALSRQIPTPQPKLDAMLAFGRIARHIQAETGLPMTTICSVGSMNYRSATRYVAISAAADRLLAAGKPVPNTATAILATAKAI